MFFCTVKRSITKLKRYPTIGAEEEEDKALDLHVAIPDLITGTS